MRIAVCLHGGAVAGSSLPLHATDRHAIRLASAMGAEIAVIEAVGQRGCAPAAIAEGLAMGATRGVRVVDPALDGVEAQIAGLVLAAALERLEVDLVLFGDDADPDGSPDVPACIAHHMTALYLDGAVDLRAAGGDGPVVRGRATDASTMVEITLASGPWIRRLTVNTNAVIGLSPVDRAAKPATEAHRGELGAARPPHSPHALAESDRPRPPHGAVEVMTLTDLAVDPALVRRRHDRRGGAADLARRPLVTLHSVAAIAALLGPR